jgi:hypothetical protein
MQLLVMQLLVMQLLVMQKTNYKICKYENKTK